MSDCIICEEPVDKNAHTVHGLDCWSLLGHNYECDCTPNQACFEHCPNPLCIIARAKHAEKLEQRLEQAEQGNRSLLAGYRDVAGELPEDNRGAFLEKFEAIEARMGLGVQK